MKRRKKSHCRRKRVQSICGLLRKRSYVRGPRFIIYLHYIGRSNSGLQLLRLGINSRLLLWTIQQLLMMLMLRIFQGCLKYLDKRLCNWTGYRLTGLSSNSTVALIELNKILFSMMNTFLDNVKVYKWLLLLEAKRQTFSKTIPDVPCFSIFHAKLSEKPSRRARRVFLVTQFDR